MRLTEPELQTKFKLNYQMFIFQRFWNLKKGKKFSDDDFGGALFENSSIWIWSGLWSENWQSLQVIGGQRWISIDDKGNCLHYSGLFIQTWINYTFIIQIFWKQCQKLETCCFCCIEYDCTFTVFGWLKKELANIISVKELISLRTGFRFKGHAASSDTVGKSLESEEFLVWFQHKIDTPREDINQYWTITNEEILQYIMKNFFSVESLKPLYIDLIRKPDF